jgi:hypothetical protein
MSAMNDINEIGGAVTAADDGRGGQTASETTADAGNLDPRRTGTASSGTRAQVKWAREGKVRLHPIPIGCPQELADYVAMCVRGAIKDGLNKHAGYLTNAQRGILIGSIGKRAVNSLCSADGLARIRDILVKP